VELSKVAGNDLCSERLRPYRVPKGTTWYGVWPDRKLGSSLQIGGLLVFVMVHWDLS